MYLNIEDTFSEMDCQTFDCFTGYYRKRRGKAFLFCIFLLVWIQYLVEATKWDKSILLSFIMIDQCC